jgi:hypothetical protein
VLIACLASRPQLIGEMTAPTSTGAWGLGDEIGAALTRGESGPGFMIFNVQRL